MYPIEICEKLEINDEKSSLSMNAFRFDKVEGWQLRKLLYLPENLFWFKGHFPDRAVLPGIAQVNWLIEWAQKQEASIMGKDCVMHFSGIENLKFQKSLQPDQTIELQMVWNRPKRLLTFNYLLCARGRLQTWLKDSGVIHSSGKFKFEATE